jgi:hypothetical protein
VRSINSLILFGIRKNFQSSGRDLLLYLPTCGTACNTSRDITVTNNMKISFHILLSKLTPCIDEFIGDDQCEGENSGSHGGEYGDDYLLRYCVL